jgi:sterol desaturase/sphingolipid hydroxylase (fatty acid hydroxylase superfamily)
MIFYMLGLLSYYKLRNKPVPAGVCLMFFGVVTVPPTTTLFFIINTHWIFQALAFAGGLFCWTFIEYFVHRFLMHKKESSQNQKSHHFVHHSNPGKILTSHLRRLIITSIAILAIWSSVLFSNYLFLPAGILTGFAIYGYMHMWLHKQWAAKWLGRLQKFHISHHVGQTEKCFGVTFTWWDRIFNTAGSAEKSVTANANEVYFGHSNSQKMIA